MVRLTMVTCLAGAAASAQVREYTPPEIRQLTARSLRVFQAPEASQGVAADARHFYAVDNTVLAKYEIASAKRAGQWQAPRNGLIRHMNS